VFIKEKNILLVHGEIVIHGEYFIIFRW